MKIISTIGILYSPITTILQEYGLTNSHRQFRVSCRCRGLKHGNELCHDLSTRGIFTREYAGETGNQHTIAYFEEHPEVAYIIQDSIMDSIIVTDLQIKEELKRWNT